MKRIVLLFLISFTLFAQMEERMNPASQLTWQPAQVQHTAGLDRSLVFYRFGPDLVASFMMHVDAQQNLVMENIVTLDYQGGVVFETRRLLAPPSYTVDLESGQIGGPWHQATFQFTMLNPGNTYLEPVNAREFGLFPLNVVTITPADMIPAVKGPQFVHDPLQAYDSQGQPFSLMSGVSLPVSGNANMMILKLESEVIEDSDWTTGIRTELTSQDPYSLYPSLWAMCHTQGATQSGLSWFSDTSINQVFIPQYDSAAITVTGGGHAILRCVRVYFIAY